MAPIELNASFAAEHTAREAERKLQALRATAITHGEDGVTLSAVVDDAIVERAVHAIEQSGGTAERK